MRIVRIVPTLILAIVVMMTIPAVASATHGRSGTVIKKEQVTVYTSHSSRSYDRSRSHYHQPANNSYRHSSNKQFRQPPRHAPAHGYYKKHYRPAPDKHYRHRSPQTRGHVLQGTSITVRIGF